MHPALPFGTPSCPRRPGGLALGKYALAALGLLALAPAARAQTQDLFVSNQNNGGRISRFAGTGPGTFSTTATTFSTGLGYPSALALDAQGDLFATYGNTGPGKIDGNLTEFASTGAGTFGAGTTFATGLSFPVGLAFDGRGDLFVANLNGGNNGNSIMEFASTGAGTFGAGTTFASGGTLSGPFGLAFDSKDDLFASNSFGNTITEFAATGVGAFAVGKTFATGLNDPGGLAFDAQGDLFEVQQFGNSLTEFAATGAGIFGTGKAVGANMSFPEGLAFGPSASAPVPEASTTVSLGLLLVLGMGGVVVAARRKRRA